ncbi:hypothetical protein KJE20_12784 [Pyrenophora tritici-repentis]|nr:hypothetical protein KJE20_12784 [Pyrenophora tritici-repentis]
MTGLAIIHEDYEDPTPTPNTPARGWVVCRRDSPAAHTLEAPPNPMFVVTPSILVNRNCSAECVCETKQDALSEMRRRAFAYRAANQGEGWCAYDSQANLMTSL